MLKGFKPNQFLRLLKEMLVELKAIRKQLEMRPYTITVGGSDWSPEDWTGDGERRWEEDDT